MSNDPSIDTRATIDAVERLEGAQADDVGILACKYCDGMEEGDVFIHDPRCPWQVAKRSHDSAAKPKN